MNQDSSDIQQVPTPAGVLALNQQLPFQAEQLKDANHCVMCGLCLPHCPTYNLLQQEADSPRGRISLIKAMATEAILPDQTLVEHLEGCLMCRRCETVCPAEVPFSRLLDRAKQQLFTTASTAYRLNARLPWWLGQFVRMRTLRRWIKGLLWLYHSSGIRVLLRKTYILRGLGIAGFDALLPQRIPLISYRQQAKTGRPQVALFTGCAGEVLDSETLQAAKKLIHTVGFEVLIPAQQNCCGAVHQHSGDRQSAEALLAQNAMAFRDTSQVVSCASGCGIQLEEHAAQLNIQHDDINHFLLQHCTLLHFRECDTTVTLHTPCTMQSDDAEKLLHLVPQLRVRALSEQSTCCGAAGAHMFSHPTAAEAFLAPLLDALIQQGTNILLTTNIGCMLHFRRGLAKRGAPIEVMHPIRWLAQHLA